MPPNLNIKLLNTNSMYDVIMSYKIRDKFWVSALQKKIQLPKSLSKQGDITRMMGVRIIIYCSITCPLKLT